MKFSIFLPLVSCEHCREQNCPRKMSLKDMRQQRIQSLKFQVMKEISRRYELSELLVDYSGPPPEEHEIEMDAEDALELDNPKCELPESGKHSKVIIHSHEESNAGLKNNLKATVQP